MKALELADMIERYNAGVMSQAICEDYLKVVDELRRLAAVEAERDALEEDLERIKALEPVAWRWWDDENARWAFTLWPDECGDPFRDFQALYALGSKT